MLKKNRSKNSKTRNREIAKVINEVVHRYVHPPRETKKGIKLIDKNLLILGRNNTDLLRFKGHLLDILGKEQESAKIYREILRLIPNHIEATIDLGDTYKNLEEFRRALTYYNKVLRLIKTGKGHTGLYRFDVKGEDFIQAVKGKAETLLALKRPREALKCIVNALQYYPDDIMLCFWLKEAQEQFHKIKSK